MMKKVLLLFSVIILLTLAGCSKEKQFDKKLEDILTDFEAIGNVYNLSIVVNDTLIKEHHLEFSDNETKRNVFSVTKSVTSLLVGIAIEEGYINSVDDSISDYIDISSYENESELEALTIKHLLTMTSGIEWNSIDLGAEMRNLKHNDNSVDMILKRDVVFTHGTQFNYSDGAAHLMSAVMKEATNKSLHDYAKEKLFEPLGIENTYWYADRQGVSIGGCELQLTNLQMIEIGKLVRNDGVYNGKQVVSKEWLEESTNASSSSIPSAQYGYYWWISYVDDMKVLSARGWGGQYIFIVPSLSLIITTQANGAVSNEANVRQGSEIFSLVHEDLIPLILEYPHLQGDGK